MALLSPTPPAELVDARGRPYFLRDRERTLAELRDRWRSGDVFTFVSLAQIARMWGRLQPHFGRMKASWTWILRQWSVLPDG